MRWQVQYLVVIEKGPSSFGAYVPDLPGVIATGKTKAMVEKNIFSAIQFHIEGLKEENMRIPKAHAESEILEFPL